MRFQVLTAASMKINPSGIWRRVFALYTDVWDFVCDCSDDRGSTHFRNFGLVREYTQSYPIWYFQLWKSKIFHAEYFVKKVTRLEAWWSKFDAVAFHAETFGCQCGFFHTPFNSHSFGKHLILWWTNQEFSPLNIIPPWLSVFIYRLGNEQ
jgi:hypothetical protein